MAAVHAEWRCESHLKYGGYVGSFRYLLLIAVAAFCFAASSQKVNAQIAEQTGPVPVCPYGYFDYPPNDCAPYGYYAPEWFSGGDFIGAGSWYRGRENLRGHAQTPQNAWAAFLLVTLPASSLSADAPRSTFPFRFG